MEILVGVPTHRRPQLLRQCLESIAKQTGVAATVRVFVADNDPVRREGIAVVRELQESFRFPITASVVAEPGISAVRNAILDEARNSRADFIAMIDDDETAINTWLVNLIDTQTRTAGDVVGGPAEPAFIAPPSPLALKYWTPKRLAEGCVDCLSGSGNILVSCHALWEHGWPQFHSAFGLTGGGDAEWFSRLRQGGAVFAWSAAAVTYETVPPERSTDEWVIRRTFRYSNSQTRILIMHREWSALALHLGVAFLILAASPLLLTRLLSRTRRAESRERLARAIGRLAGLFGIHFHEYAERHREGSTKEFR